MTQLHFVTCMEDMQVKLCNHELEFADVFVKGKNKYWSVPLLFEELIQNNL